MAYLDLSPMLHAMRTRPAEFEMQGSYLRHVPSHHLLNFDIWGNARVHARCDCAMLEVSRAQSEEMKSAIAAWKVVYWEPHVAQLEAERQADKINREFAAHFRPSLWRRIKSFFGVHEPAALPLVAEMPEPTGSAPTGSATAARKAARTPELAD